MVAQVRRLQDDIKAEQKAAGKFETPNWDQASQKKVRDAQLVLGSTIPDFRKAFGTGWNYTVRPYRPRPEIPDGKWKFPEPNLVNEGQT